MLLVEREHIDINKWDALVKSTPNVSPFSTSWYLDAVAENWCVLVDADYTAGIALPYTIRAAQEILYTPIFTRYSEWLGEKAMIEDHIDKVLNRFKIAEVTLRTKLIDDSTEEFVYQEIDPEKERTLHTQAQRSLKKADKHGLTVKTGTDYNNVFKVVETELSGKIAGIDNQSMKALNKLFIAAKEASVLKVFEVIQDETSCGGIVCIEFQNRLLYLKGTVVETVKKNGGMYKALNEAILYAQDKQLIFDFGGSRQEGVKAFNHNLGGLDTVYYSYRINNGPKWFSLARSIRNKWIGK